MSVSTNKKLAIAIPTYNRPQILYENLTAILPELEVHQVAVYVSDNGPDEETEHLMLQLKSRYNNIYYVKDKNNPGYENNIVATLLMPTEDYVWLLGDGMQIGPGYLKQVLGIVNNNDYDFIGLNTQNRRVNIEATVYHDPKKLLADLNWHLTLLGATIYSRKIIPYIHTLDIHRFRNFTQNALIFHCMALPGASFFWSALPAITGNNKKQSYWNNKVFDTFLVDLTNTIENLPAVYKPIAKTVYSAHATHSKLFSLYNLLSYRQKNILNYENYKKYKAVMQLSTEIPLYKWLIISKMPLFIVRPLIAMADVLKKVRDKTTS